MSDTGEHEPVSGFKAQLHAVDGTIWELQDEMRIGRSSDCEITIDDPRVSRTHAKITVLDECVRVIDLDSANGTRVNNSRVEETVELADGDSVSFEKHSFRVVIKGLDNDATVVDSDATLVSGYDAITADAVATEPETPAPENVPGSWVEAGSGEHTRVLMPGATADISGSPASVARESDLPHLLVLSEGTHRELLELEVTAGNNPDVWEIGRGDNCEITLPDPSVSTRHAQLIHQGDRWRLVNLVSANGIYVNDEKRLTAYLADGDEIRLGLARMVFRAASGTAAQAGVVNTAAPGSPRKTRGRAALIIGIGALAIGLIWSLRQLL